MFAHIRCGAGHAAYAGGRLLCLFPRSASREPLWGIVSRQCRKGRKGGWSETSRPWRALREPFSKMKRAGGEMGRQVPGWMILRAGCDVLPPVSVISSTALVISPPVCAILSTAFAILSPVFIILLRVFTERCQQRAGRGTFFDRIYRMDRI